MNELRIRRIEIRDFRGIRGTKVFDLKAPTGSAVSQFVLAGPNGCGKTSVLEAVLLALGRADLLVRDFPKEARDGHWRTQLAKNALIRVEIETGAKQIETREVTEATASSIEPLAQVAYFSSWRAPYLVGAVGPLGRGRRPDDTESNRIWRLKQRIVDEYAKRGFATQLTLFEPDDWLAKLNKAWKMLHGDDGTEIVAELVDPSREDAYSDLFVQRDGKRICSIDQVSSGELELLSFAGWIVITEFRCGVLVIDEPELHLHPEWQAAILPALRELAPDAQFLIATHSEAPWNAAYSFERALLVPESDPRSATRR